MKARTRTGAELPRAAIHIRPVTLPQLHLAEAGPEQGSEPTPEPPKAPEDSPTEVIHIPPERTHPHPEQAVLIAQQARPDQAAAVLTVHQVRLDQAAAVLSVQQVRPDQAVLTARQEQPAEILLMEDQQARRAQAVPMHQRGLAAEGQMLSAPAATTITAAIHPAITAEQGMVPAAEERPKDALPPFWL